MYIFPHLYQKYAAKDDTQNDLKRVTEDPNFVVVPGDKDSCVTMMNKWDYQNKCHEMVDDEIHRGGYKVTENKTLDDLKSFDSFLYRNFKK